MKRAVWLVSLASAVWFATGCNDLSERWELDRPRVLGVRLSDPGLLPGESTRITMLASDSAGVPSEGAPLLVSMEELAPPAEIMAALQISQDDEGWLLTAGDEAAIMAARAKLELTEEEPLDIQFGMLSAVEGEQLFTIKKVRVGAQAENPPIPTIAIGDGGGSALPRQTEVSLVCGNLPEDPSGSDDKDPRHLDETWFTSIGSLGRSQTREAKLTIGADEPSLDTEYAVVVIRNPAGGTSWQTASFTVED